MLKRVLMFILLPLGLLTLLGYYWLGGFHSVTIEVVENEPRPIVAKPYQGQYGDLALRKVFVEAKELQEKGTVPGLLTVVNRDSASATGQSVNQLIGITLTAPLDTVPPGYQRDTIPAGHYLRAILQSNQLVMPHPEEVHEQLTTYADEHRLSVSGLPIEIYRANDTLWIEMAIL